MGLVSLRVSVTALVGALGFAVAKMVGYSGVFVAAAAMQMCLGIPPQVVVPEGMPHRAPMPARGTPHHGVDRAVLHLAHVATLMMGQGPEMVLEAYGLEQRLTQAGERRAGQGRADTLEGKGVDSSQRGGEG